MTTLFLLLAALSALPFSTLYEKHINYISTKDLGKENTRNNISDANDTGNCSRKSIEKTPINESASGAEGNVTAEKGHDLSESYEEVGNKSGGAMKLIADDKSFVGENTEEKVNEGKNTQGREDISPESKLTLLQPSEK